MFVYRKSFDIALLTFFSKLREIQGVNRHIYIYMPDRSGAAAENWASPEARLCLIQMTRWKLEGRAIRIPSKTG
jgi:hypothetical protein